MQLSLFVTRWRWVVVAAWGLAGVGLFLFVPSGSPGADEQTSYLPEDSTYRIAARQLEKYFPQQGGLSQAVVIFERSDGPLTLEDNTYINTFAQKIKRPYKRKLNPAELGGLTVSTPGLIDLALGAARGADSVRKTKRLIQRLFNPRSAKTQDEEPPLTNPLRTALTDAGQAAIVRVNIPADFITHRSREIVGHIRDILVDHPRPTGLKVAVSGSAGYGYDYELFVQQSYKRTIFATLIAVVVILLVVYRAPLAAMVPLVSISLAAAIVIVLMNLAQNLGAGIGLAERIFVFVLMYGAGIDYSLLFISRYRELLASGRTAQQAPAEALSATSPAIFASAATDAAGVLMLVFSQFLIFRTTGPAVAGALIVSMLASVTLVPSLVSILGPRMFWPRRAGKTRPRRERFWRALARCVTHRAGLVLIAMLVLLIIPAVKATRISWIYDALEGIDSEWLDGQSNKTSPDKGVGNAAAGIEMAKRHLPIGEIAPVTILIESQKPLSLKQWWGVSTRLVKAIGRTDGIGNVRTLTQPVGRGVKIATGSPGAQMIKAFAAGEYLSGDYRSLRTEAIMTMHTMSNEAMRLAETLKGVAEDVLRSEGIVAGVHLTGPTAQMLEIRTVTQRDFKLVAVLVLGVVFVIILVLLRDWLLSLFMVGMIPLSYMATLGVCSWAFGWLFGDVGMDWKVQIFLFVVMAAVGVDYNIFLASRLAQEARRYPPREAVARALVHTGPVISSCGLIMAATLGSLCVGQVELLRQLGFALATGMLIDTFLVRPLMLPAFAALFKRTGKSRILLG